MKRKKARKLRMRSISPVELSRAFANDSNADGAYVVSVNVSTEVEPDRLLFLEMTPERARALAALLIDRASEAEVRNIVVGAK